MKAINDLDTYFDELKSYKEECLLLRALLLSSGLSETIKWGCPVYTFKGKNVIGLAAFKGYAGLWFFKGAALKDELNILVKGSDKTHTQMQWRFSKMADIKKKNVVQYIHEAILVEEMGVRIANTSQPITIDPILLSALASDLNMSSAWDKLSKTIKREYIDYINEAKKQETKLTRLQKITPMIISGVGLHDKYR